MVRLVNFTCLVGTAGNTHDGVAMGKSLSFIDGYILYTHLLNNEGVRIIYLYLWVSDI